MTIVAMIVTACASCGSGGDAPLVLYPNETVKAYFALTRQDDFSVVDGAGVRGAEIGPQTKQTAVAAVGATFLTDGFATLTLPRVENARDGRSDSGVGDPLLSVHWTIVQPSMLSPKKPQVQVFAAHKKAVGRSVYEAEDVSWLDVFGGGFDESRVGADLWWGSSTVKAGIAATVLSPHAREIDGVERRPGRGARATATVGYAFGELGKVVAGTTVERRGKREAGGEAIKGSETVDNAVFLGGDVMVTATQAVRLTVSRSAAYGRNRNASSARGVTLAWLGAW